MYRILLVFNVVAVGVALNNISFLDSSGKVLNIQDVNEDKFVLALRDVAINEFNLTIEVKKSKCIKVSLDECRPLEFRLPDTDINGNWGLLVSSSWLRVSKDGVSVVDYEYDDHCYQKMWLTGNYYQFSTQHIPGTVQVKSMDDRTLPNCSYTFLPNYSSCKRISENYCRTTYYRYCVCNGIRGLDRGYCRDPSPDYNHDGAVDCSECFSGRCINKKDENGDEIESICPRDPFSRCSGEVALTPFLVLVVTVLSVH